MKKQILLSILAMLPMLTFADPVLIAGLYYNLFPKGGNFAEVTFLDYTGYCSGDIVIPEKVKYNNVEYTVTMIGSLTFEGSSLTSITIPNSVTSIGSGAFANCSYLTSVTIPNSVTSIGNRAFEGCLGLTSVTIGNSVTSIEKSTFSSCHSLTSITIPNSVTSIGEDAFKYCDDLTTITIPNSVESIGDKAFEECRGLTSITIGNGLKSIGEDAFKNCENLTLVNISDLKSWCKISCSTGRANPLWYARKLYLNGVEVKELVIPNGVESIGQYAFVYGLGFTSVTIPNSVKSIEAGAFYECCNLTSVHITDLKSWCEISMGSSNPLWDAHKLYLNGVEVKNLVIPDGVESIGKNAFRGCSMTSVTIPNCVTSIGECAFYYCTDLTSVTIGNSVKSIEVKSFYGCSGLTSVTIGNSMESIGAEAFFECSSLTSVTLPNSLTSIGVGAFYGCGLTTVTIPKNVKQIGGEAAYGVQPVGAFANCNQLTDVYCKPDKVNNGYGEGLYTSTDTFDGSYPKYMTLHVPAVAVNDYGSIEPWSKFGKIVPLDTNADVNGDGKVDLKDAKAIADFIATGNTNGLDLQRADINGDGKIDVADIVAIIKIING